MMIKRIKRFTRQNIDRIIFGSKFPLQPWMEAVYQQLVQRDLAHLGVTDKFYPLGGAANYALFYIVLRIVSEFRIKNIVEFGAGQTTLLFDALSHVGALTGDVLTVEHNNEWADRIADLVSHRIFRTSLVPKSLDSLPFEGYDLSELNAQAIELLVIDGPPASSEDKAFSRLGALDIIDCMDPSGFVIIIDDANREGEMLLAEKIESALTKRGLTYESGQVISNRRQILIAGGKFTPVVYY